MFNVTAASLISPYFNPLEMLEGIYIMNLQPAQLQTHRDQGSA